VVITIKKNGEKYELAPPPNSRTDIDPNGNATVTIRASHEGSPAPAAANPGDELKSLQGLWKVVRVEKAKDSTWQLQPKGGGIAPIVEGTNVCFEEPRETRGFENPRVWFFRPGFWNEPHMGFYYRIGAAASPKTIDLVNEPVIGRNNGGRLDMSDLAAVGIYEINANQLKIRLTEAPPSFLSANPRPKDFSPDLGSSGLLLVLQRCPHSADEAKIEGPWTIISKTFDGAPVSTTPYRPCFSGNTVDGDLIRDDVGRDRSVVFALDPTKSPPRIAMYSRAQLVGAPLSMRRTRKAEFGVYKFEGDKLIIAVRQGGALPSPESDSRGGGRRNFVGQQESNIGPPPEKFESAFGSGVTLLVLQRLVLNAEGDYVQTRGADGAPSGSPAREETATAAPPKVPVLRPVSGVLSDYVLTRGSISLEKSGSAAAGPRKTLQFHIEDPAIASRLSQAMFRQRQFANNMLGDGNRGGGTDAVVSVYYTYEVEKDVEYRAEITSMPFPEHPYSEATIAKNDHIAAPGMSVLVRLPKRENQNQDIGILFPQRAFFYKGGKLFAYVVNERNSVQPRAVQYTFAKSSIACELRSRFGVASAEAPTVGPNDLVVADASLVKPGMVIRPDFIAGALLGPAAPVEFQEKPLTEVVKHLQDAHHIQIKIDERSLAAAGVKPDVPCTMYLHEATLATALRLLLRSVGLTYVVEDNYILITAPGKEPPKDDQPRAKPAER
jgi:uncharacterized protein (TIGR03067 family)